MKSSMYTGYIEKLARLEGELLKLKKSRATVPRKATVRLGGSIRGVDITEGDITAAKDSLFKKGKRSGR